MGTGKKAMEGRAICPVCGMIVSRASHFKGTFRSRRYYFCCNDCKTSFEADPYKYIAYARGGKHG